LLRDVILQRGGQRAAWGKKTYHRFPCREISFALQWGPPNLRGGNGDRAYRDRSKKNDRRQATTASHTFRGNASKEFPPGKGEYRLEGGMMLKENWTAGPGTQKTPTTNVGGVVRTSKKGGKIVPVLTIGLDQPSGTGK